MRHACQQASRSVSMCRSLINVHFSQSKHVRIPLAFKQGWSSVGLHSKSLPCQVRQPGHFERQPFHVRAAAKGSKTIFKCNQPECGREYLLDQSQCDECGAWNCLVPVVVEAPAKGGGEGLRVAKEVQKSFQPGRAAGQWPSKAQPKGGPRGGLQAGWLAYNKSSKPERLHDISKLKKGKHWRIPLSGPTGEELGRVLGGGVVPGSMTLLGGDPGIGKSTLLLQLAGMLVEPTAVRSFSSASSGANEPAASSVGQNGHSAAVALPGNESTIANVAADLTDMGVEEEVAEDEPGVLYVSAEESAEQVNSRAERMEGLDMYNIWVLAETRLVSIMQEIAEMRPRAVVIDSIQTVYLDGATGTAGSVSQVRECAAALTRLCKDLGIPMFLVGHVTKSGDIAGPRVLEHMVDTVLYMEGEGQQRLRLLRGIKNRFGATNEVGVFTMDERGLKPVANPSALFINNRNTMGSEGASSAVCVTMNGARPLLVEIQALCSESHQGKERPPLRTSSGIDRNRLQQVEAIVRKHSAVPSGKMDMHTNVIGGFKIVEPAADLAIGVALASSSLETVVAPDIAFIGELGLNGEIRNVTNLAQRLQEVDKLGFKRCVIPALTEELNTSRLRGVRVLKCKKLSEALLHALA